MPTDRENLITYVSRYGGRCRDCADNHGICENSGLPCEPEIERKAIAHVLDAVEYGVTHGFIPNPLKS